MEMPVRVSNAYPALQKDESVTNSRPAAIVHCPPRVVLIRNTSQRDHRDNSINASPTRTYDQPKFIATPGASGSYEVENRIAREKDEIPTIRGFCPHLMRSFNERRKYWHITLLVNQALSKFPRSPQSL